MGLNRPMKVLIEIAPSCGRAGIRHRDSVNELAAEIVHGDWNVQLEIGIECYEGVIR